MREAVDNLLRDKTRPPGKATLDAKIVKRIVDLTLADPLGELASAYALWGRRLAPPSTTVETFAITSDHSRPLKRVQRRGSFFFRPSASPAGLRFRSAPWQKCCRSALSRRAKLWIVKVEYLYYDLGKVTYALSPLAFSSSTRINGSAVRAGLGAPAPVVAG